MYLYTFFYSFDFYLWPFYFIFCVLSFVFKILTSERFLSFIVFCLLRFNFQLFYFCLLCLNFCILYFDFWFSHASSMIKGHPSTLSNFGNRQRYRQTGRQLIANRIWEGDGNRIIDRYVLHLMPSNFRLHFIRPTE